MVAWMWECPQCKKRYYTSGQRISDDEAKEQAKEEFGCDGELVTAPSEVHCVKCEKDFPTQVEGEGQDE